MPHRRDAHAAVHAGGRAGRGQVRAARGFEGACWGAGSGGPCNAGGRPAGLAGPVQLPRLRTADLSTALPISGPGCPALRSYLERYRPLAKYTKAAAGGQLPERVARYAAQGEPGETCPSPPARLPVRAAPAPRAGHTGPAPPPPFCAPPLPRLAVLLDLLQTLPVAPLVKLQPGEQYRQAAHLMLLQASCLWGWGGAVSWGA